MDEPVSKYVESLKELAAAQVKAKAAELRIARATLKTIENFERAAGELDGEK